MSNEVQQQSSFGTTVASYGLMPGITIACSGASALKTHGIKGLRSAQNKKAFEALDKAMKNQGVDAFTRSQALARSYDGYKDIAKRAAKAEKAAAKISKKGAKYLPVMVHIRNAKNKILNKIFKGKIRPVVTAAEYRKGIEDAVNPAADALKKANGALNGIQPNNFAGQAGKLDDALGLTADCGINAKALSNAAESVAEGAVKATGKAAAKTTMKNLGKSFMGNFKREFTLKYGLFNYIFPIVEFGGRVIKDVIPAFKEKGFAGGIKETGKALLKGAADLVGSAAGASAGRIIGSAIGLGVSTVFKFIPKGVATRIGGNLGDMIGSMFMCNVTRNASDKITGKGYSEKKAEEAATAQYAMAQEEIQQEIETTPQQQPAQTVQAQTYQQPQTFRGASRPQVATRLDTGRNSDFVNRKMAEFYKKQSEIQSSVNFKA